MYFSISLNKLALYEPHNPLSEEIITKSDFPFCLLDSRNLLFESPEELETQETQGIFTPQTKNKVAKKLMKNLALLIF